MRGQAVVAVSKAGQSYDSRSALRRRLIFHAFLKLLLHQPADLEFDSSLGRNLNSFKGFGILGDSRSPRLGLEDTKVPEFQPVALSQLTNDFIKEFLEDILDDDSLDVGQVGNTINQFFFRNRVH